MDKRGHHDTPMLAAGAVRMFAQFVHVHLAPAVTEETQDSRDGKAHRNGRKYFKKRNLDEERHRRARRNEDGQKFVGSRKHNRQERARRNHSAGVKRGRRRRHSALRNGAGQRPGQRPYGTSTLEESLERTSRLGFHVLQHQIGDKEEREQQQGLFDEFQH